MSKHSASGSLYGYLFQFDRALYWLACRGTKVGIETEDDVVSFEAKGKTIREQDKCSIVNTNPLSNRSKNLWKSLKIWVDAIEAGEVDLSNTEFHLVTNIGSSECLARQMGRAKDDDSIDLCVEKLRDLGKNPSDSISDYVGTVLGCNDETLKEMIRRIYFTDSDNYGREDLMGSIVSCLHIPETLPSDKIINELLGWMVSRAKTLWLSGKPAWITKEEFDEYYSKVSYRFSTQKFIETPARDLMHLIDINLKDHMDRIFVKQLSLLEIEDDYIMDSIRDYNFCSYERTRIAQQGSVTKGELDNFENVLVERWKPIFMRNSSMKMHPDIINGIKTYTETIDHKEPLAGQSTENYYLTRGTYHMLADILDVGWHPKFKELLKSNGGDYI